MVIGHNRDYRLAGVGVPRMDTRRSREFARVLSYDRNPFDSGDLRCRAAFRPGRRVKKVPGLPWGGRVVCREHDHFHRFLPVRAIR